MNILSLEQQQSKGLDTTPEAVRRFTKAEYNLQQVMFLIIAQLLEGEPESNNIQTILQIYNYVQRSQLLGQWCYHIAKLAKVLLNYV